MMKRISMLFMAICITASFALEAGASYMDGLDGMTGSSLTAPVSFAPDSGAFGTGLDINGWFFYVNGGLAFRHWYEDVPARNDGIRNEVAAYVGAGAANAFQLQLGLSNAGTSLRLRSDLRFGKDSVLAVAPFLEISSHGAENLQLIFGIGIGVSLDRLGISL